LPFKTVFGKRIKPISAEVKAEEGSRALTKKGAIPCEFLLRREVIVFGAAAFSTHPQAEAAARSGR
jgi:hypothetical protein